MFRAGLLIGLATTLLMILPTGCNRGGGEAMSDLRDAVQAGDREKVAKLIKDRPKLVNSKTQEEEMTALHFAADGGHVEIVGLLLDSGAPVNAVNKKGNTPLILAVGRGHAEVVKLLLKKGADTAMTASGDNSALHKAASNGQAEIVKIFLDHGVDPNLKLASGTTPLHNAAMLGKKEVVVILLANGADPLAKRNDGATPLDWTYGRNPEVREILRQHAEGQ